MKLPEKLEKDFRLSCGHPPLHVVRGLYDVDGNLGGTWLAVGHERVFLFHRASGRPFQRKRHSLEDLIETRLEAEEDFACLHFRFAEAQYQVRCSLFDLQVLDRIAAHCSKVAQARPVDPPARLNPASAFCAAIHAALDADGRVDPVETEWLCRMLPDPVAISQGSAWLRAHGLDALLSALPAELKPAQRQCLMANLIAGVMADGFLEPDEQALIERFRGALEIAPEDFDRMFSVLLTRNQLTVLLSDNDEPAPAMNVFAAALIALTKCDNERHENEDAHLRRILPMPDLLRAAEAIAAEDILDRHAEDLNKPQRRCLLANLLAVAMVDGRLETAEQQLIDRMRRAMAIPDAEYEQARSVLLCKNDLSVLA